ncbi:quinolinate synthase NadA [Candidatus Sumerlaeota bacterium]|nr:quinolinate synthase NadA [Candidatus Sumerlaeota bacterium]
MSSSSRMPSEYARRADSDLIDAIRKTKDRLGGEAAILGHHYQREAIVDLSDFVGDSFKLCRDAAQAAARHIVFCGVRFMAESARVVARPEQTVQHPDVSAGCPMANMAFIVQVEEIWKVLAERLAGRRIVPVTYMNSSVELKAFCGRSGGVVCTSSNASRVFDWAYSRGDVVFFFPDEHLGRNTGNARGTDPARIRVWDPMQGEAQAGDPSMAGAELILWKGFCHVHTFFTVDHVRRAREAHPDAFVIVHPECTEDVVRAADAAGSTEAIVRAVSEASPGAVIVIGTETHLVSRLANTHPDKTVLPLARSVCPNMQRITLANLLWSLENIGEYNIVEVEEEVARDARVALERMLQLA